MHSIVFRVGRVFHGYGEFSGVVQCVDCSSGSSRSASIVIVCLYRY